MGLGYDLTSSLALALVATPATMLGAKPPAAHGSETDCLKWSKLPTLPNSNLHNMIPYDPDIQHSFHIQPRQIHFQCWRSVTVSSLQVTKHDGCLWQPSWVKQRESWPKYSPQLPNTIGNGLISKNTGTKTSERQAQCPNAKQISTLHQWIHTTRPVQTSLCANGKQWHWSCHCFQSRKTKDMNLTCWKFVLHHSASRRDAPGLLSNSRARACSAATFP